MKLNRIISTALCIAMLLAFAGCSADKTAETTEKQTENTQEETKSAASYSWSKENYDYPVFTITMADGGVMTGELYPDVAPNTVANFISLANSEKYNGLIFHRIIYNFMIQGGDPTGTGFGDFGYSIAGEFTQNGFENNLSHTKGVLSMARSQDPNSACGQFFICSADAMHLDGQYAAFGKLTDGYDVLESLSAVDTDVNDKPIKDVVIKSITVDTKGFDFPEPDKI